MSELKSFIVLYDGKFIRAYEESEADKVIAELKAREDVLVTDNRNLLDKVKKLENHLRENAEHFKRNEAQIIESSDNVIKKLKAENERLNNLLNVWNTYKVLSNTYKELKFTKRALWVARADRAVAEQTVDEWSRYKEKHPFGSWRADPFEYWVQAWIYVEKLCRKKAKEYK